MWGIISLPWRSIKFCDIDILSISPGSASCPPTAEYGSSGARCKATRCQFRHASSLPCLSLVFFEITREREVSNFDGSKKLGTRFDFFFLFLRDASDARTPSTYQADHSSYTYPAARAPRDSYVYTIVVLTIWSSRCGDG